MRHEPTSTLQAKLVWPVPPAQQALQALQAPQAPQELPEPQGSRATLAQRARRALQASARPPGHAGNPACAVPCTRQSAARRQPSYASDCSCSSSLQARPGRRALLGAALAAAGRGRRGRRARPGRMGSRVQRATRAIPASLGSRGLLGPRATKVGGWAQLLLGSRRLCAAHAGLCMPRAMHGGGRRAPAPTPLAHSLKHQPSQPMCRHSGRCGTDGACG